MNFEDYDGEYGYSASGLSRSYSKRAYNLPEHDLASISEIERCIKEGIYFECHEHVAYLEELQKSLLIISVAEEREGILNWELHEVLDRIKELLYKLSSAGLVN